MRSGRLDGFTFEWKPTGSTNVQKVTTNLRRRNRSEALPLELNNQEENLHHIWDLTSDHSFQLIAQAYEHRSLIVTSNLDFQDWGRLFDQPATAAAFLDRLLHHAHVITLKGDSCRIRHRQRS